MNKILPYDPNTTKFENEINFESYDKHEWPALKK